MWNISFITEDDFKKHVKETIMKYGEKLDSFDLKKFNKNIVDPIKLIFDKTVYRSDWETIISNEIFRQREDTNFKLKAYPKNLHKNHKSKFLFDFLDAFLFEISINQTIMILDIFISAFSLILTNAVFRITARTAAGTLYLKILTG